VVRVVGESGRAVSRVRPEVKESSSGYWLVWWSRDLWIQFPKGREATLADGFGWVTEGHVAEANLLTRSR